MRKLSEQEIINFFWENVEKTDACWNWIGRLSKNGTPTNGKFNPKKFSLLLNGANFVGARQIMHTCNNKICVNPDHLIVGDAARFWSKVIKTEGCWIWMGQKDKFGYGKFQYSILSKKHYLRTHQYSYLITHGTLSHGRYVRHTCDNPSCVNPDHLIPGSHQDNTEDMVKRDRQAKGSGHANSKLTEQSVREIRELHYLSTLINKTKDIAIRYGVSTHTIRRIVSRRAWKHVQ